MMGSLSRSYYCAPTVIIFPLFMRFDISREPFFRKIKHQMKHHHCSGCVVYLEPFLIYVEIVFCYGPQASLAIKQDIRCRTRFT